MSLQHRWIVCFSRMWQEIFPLSIPARNVLKGEKLCVSVWCVWIIYELGEMISHYSFHPSGRDRSGLGGGVETTMLTPVPDPQGTLLNTWKPVWVVLSEDAVEFYKKKTDRSPKGMIPLKGATILSPCQDFGKRLVSRK